MGEPILISWSGGKDSAMTLEALRADPRWRVAGLLTSVDADGGVRGQGIPGSILRRQAAVLDLPLFEALSAGAGNDAYESSFSTAVAAARGRIAGLRHVAFGDLFLADIRAYREALLARLGLVAEFPLWGRDTAVLARSFVARGHRAIVCRVDTTQLDGGFCGHGFDDALLSQLPASCDPCGERGEFHTCLHAGPLLARTIPFAVGACAMRDGRFMELDLRIA